MLRKNIVIYACLLWLGSFILLIPATFQFPKLLSLAGLLLVLYAPYSWLGKAELYIIADYSYWMGLFIMFLTSGMLILAA